MKIIQITDTHLVSDENNKFLGLNPNKSFDAVIDHILNSSFTPDIALLTGDFIQDDLASSYRVLTKGIDKLATPTYWLPGNHDTEDLYNGAFSSSYVSSEKIIVNDSWQIVLLNTSQGDGIVPGLLSRTEQEFLSTELSAHKDKHCLICMHHHPVDIGSAWLDEIGLLNSSEFWEIVDKKTQVRGVVWGHVHQQFEGVRNNIRLMGTPSTCVQFAINSPIFKIDMQQPGYRVLELSDDGTIHSEIIRLQDFELSVDKNATHY